MNSTGKFLVSALLLHAASLKRASDNPSLTVPPPRPDGTAAAPQPALAAK